MRIELPKELQVMNEVINSVEHIYLVSNLYHDGKYKLIDYDDVDLIKDDCWLISFEPAEKVGRLYAC